MGKLRQLNAPAETDLESGDATTIYQIDAVQLARLILEVQKQARQEAVELANEQPITTEDAAKFLGLNPKTVKIKAGEGKIPVHKFDGTLYFFRSELVTVIKRKGK